MDEFSLIRRYFDRRPQDVTLGIGDDGAIVDNDVGFQQIHVIDTLVAGTHFLDTMSASDIAYRAVAVNASDVAAMGGEPKTMTLALTLTEADEHWVQAFATGLFDCAEEFGVTLIGGDTTRGPCTTVTIAMMGRVEAGTALLRSGAQPGDGVYVSGNVGDAAAGLRLLTDGSPVTDDSDRYLLARFLRPTARVALGRALRGKASAAIDVSDGLVGDLRKLLDASGCGAQLDIDRLPQSDALRQRFDVDERRQFTTRGGDDYELCFTSAVDIEQPCCAVTRVGTVTAGNDLQCFVEGNIVDLADTGYRHF